MKIIFTILFFLSLEASAQTRHVFVGTGDTELRLSKPGYSDSGKYNTFFAPEQNIIPGDTIDVQGGFKLVDLYNYRGTPGKKIVIMSSTGAHIKRGISGYDMSNIIITGRAPGDTSQLADSLGERTYMLTMGDVNFRGAGVDFVGRMWNIFIDGIRVEGGAYGVRLKTDPAEVAYYDFCDSSYVHFPSRPGNNIIDSITVNRSFFKNISGDVLYIGNTNPFSFVNGNYTYYTCNGQEQFWIPMRMGNVVLSNNFMDIAGRTGIQLSGAEFGFNQIFGNIIWQMGDELNQSQGTGIAIGGATSNCWVYNNHIKRTFLYGIFDIGFGNNKIFNNRIDSTGYMIQAQESGAFNIMFPFRNRDSTIATETSNFQVEGIYFKNIHAGTMVNILSKPAAVLGYPKSIVIQNNYLGLKTGWPEDGAIAFRQDDGLNENWANGSIVCGNVNRIGAAPQVWTYVADKTYAEYSTTCEEIVFPVPGIPIKFRTKFKNIKSL